MVKLLLELESHKEAKTTKFTCIKCSSFCPYSENGNISTTLFTWLIEKYIPHIVHLDAAAHCLMPQHVAYLIEMWKRGMAGATFAILLQFLKVHLSLQVSQPPSSIQKTIDI